jgi:hypothetical protein
LGGWLAQLWQDAEQRSYELERQNMSPTDGRYTMEEYRGLMRVLAEDNTVDPRGFSATLRAFDALPSPPSSILEVGPGSGAFSRLLAVQYPNSSVLGIDASAFSIGVAKSFGEPLPNLRFEKRSSVELSEPAKSVDVITTTYVNHEIFPDADFVDFLRRVRTVGRRAFIFNDFVRSFGCLASMSLMRGAASYGQMLPGVEAFLPGDLKLKAGIFLSQTPSVLDFVLDGGLQSMRRAFTMAEYREFFREAGYPKESLHCDREDGFYWRDFLGLTCRVICTVDLA